MQGSSVSTFRGRRSTSQMSFMAKPWWRCLRRPSLEKVISPSDHIPADVPRTQLLHTSSTGVAGRRNLADDEQGSRRANCGSCYCTDAADLRARSAASNPTF
mmetsp:Transcript_19352/g.45014  ORF Transcript_19352/g.45014 Transcript_19352/m.45014 type:complete len:102 (+) Transcript_19352:2086-2391(+)